jgi:hypothetical protein
MQLLREMRGFEKAGDRRQRLAAQEAGAEHGLLGLYVGWPRSHWNPLHWPLWKKAAGPRWTGRSRRAGGGEEDRRRAEGRSDMGGLCDLNIACQWPKAVLTPLTVFH